jgi:type III secretion protein J
VSERARLRFSLALLVACGCAGEEVVHDLDELQANEVVVALDERGVAAEKRREEGADGGWTVAVPRHSVAEAQRILSERELPRPRPPGFAEVFGKGSMVPTATEERALYLHALAGELARSVEAIDGVLAARVHLAVAAPEPFRAAPAPPARAAVLVKARPGARALVDPLAHGIQALVAGAVPGLDPGAVSVVVAEGAPAAAPARPATPRARPVLLGFSALAGFGGLALLAWPLRARARVALGRRRPTP